MKNPLEEMPQHDLLNHRDHHGECIICGETDEDYTMEQRMRFVGGEQHMSFADRNGYPGDHRHDFRCNTDLSEWQQHKRIHYLFGMLNTLGVDRITRNRMKEIRTLYESLVKITELRR